MDKIHAALAVTCLVAACGCLGGDSGPQVIVYTSRDQIISEPVLKDFERQTGISVRAVYDSGATKTAGITNRLIAEKNNPQADVFWNSEISRTIVLKDEGVLVPYLSPAGADIPAKYRDLDGYWSGFGARARVIIYNTRLVSPQDAPSSIFELADPKWKGQVSIGKGWLGTMATHNAALFLVMGDARAKDYFRALKGNEVRMLIGNTAVRDSVGSGETSVGLIDTSDALEAKSYGLPIEIVYPDQAQGQMGALLIPNTISLVRGGPNPENGKKFIDYMLDRKMEASLANSVSSQIPLRIGIQTKPGVMTAEGLRLMDVDFVQVVSRMNQSNEFLLDLFAGG
jgi:iron(III) transport system substrate-binding protein